MKEVDCKTAKGSAAPLGATAKGEGINFALFSEHATAISLCIFEPNKDQPLVEIPLDPHVNRTGFVWHILLSGLPKGELEYGYRVEGPSDNPHFSFNPEVILSDPYAKGLNTPLKWKQGGCDEKTNHPRGKIMFSSPFEWGEDASPKIPMEEVVIYEMQVRSFTQHTSSDVQHPGTFLGIIEKIPYLKKLGINAIELMPIFEFNECEIKRKNPKTHQNLKNTWGYSTINFFAPMNRFASSTDWNGALNDLRTLVKELHKNKIEVYLDVVYNHTAEGNAEGPHFSFKGIDNSVYYMLNADGQYLNFSGTGNTFNCNHPVVAKMIVDSLRYWVIETHVDGFRFDLASILTRDEKGAPLASPPVVEAISQDPVLANVKLIAEAWDAGGLYQVGQFPGGSRWSEWNGKFRDCVRKFIKGTDDVSGEFARVITGSEHIYGHNRLPYHSVNFVTAHDGFSLRDLVSYQDKHNLENGEENRDGANDNESWNCGAEGPTKDKKVLQLRQQQMRNLHAALMLSIGTPMLLMGDEYGHTKKGNNNTWCQDNELNWFLWNQLKENTGFTRFYELMIQFRKQNPLLQRKSYLSAQEVDWHGRIPLQADWSAQNRFVAYSLKDITKHEDLYIAFNAHFESAQIELPPPPPGKKWYRIIDTSLASPQDFVEDPRSAPFDELSYTMKEHSTLVAKAL